MRPGQRVVLASGNAGKLAELGALLAPLGLELVAQGALGVPEAEEPWPSFVENAIAKARHASRHAGLPALADDSGLCVAALGGAPGVLSARYSAAAGGEPGDAANNARLLAALAGQPDRRAYFHCALVLLRHAEDPRPLIAEGSWHGRVAEAASGTGGFGYDPLFLPDDEQGSAAELAPARKNALSHRGRALASLLAQLRAETGAAPLGGAGGRPGP